MFSRRLLVLALLLGLCSCYYPGAVRRGGAETGKKVFVRVRLGAGGDGIRIGSVGGLLVQVGGVRQELPSGATVEFSQEGNRLVMKSGGEVAKIGADTVVITAKNGARVGIGARVYRGEILVFMAGDSGVVVVNRLSLEEYLYGVVPCEIGPIKPETFAAVKAQAVAARSFTLSRLGKRSGLGYDLFDSYLRDQEYRGAGCEKELSNRAVDETRGEVLMADGEVAEALYHANCGGRTADGLSGYLPGNYDTPGHRRSVRSFCSESKSFRWQVRISQDSLAKAIARIKCLPGGLRVKGGKLEKERSSGRVKRARFQTSRGEVVVSGNELRFGIGLRSTLFNMRFSGSGVVFAGNGWGHGVGMCQDGAVEMARRGYNYRQILNHYYPRLTVKRFY